MNSNKISMKQYFDLYFTTATVINWNPLLARDINKDVVIDAFRFSVEHQRATIWAFVIMDTHFHLVWQILPPFELAYVQMNMLKYISQTIKNRMVNNGEMAQLETFIVDKKDRYIQIWKRRPLSIPILSEKVLMQKVNYIHSNMEKKGFNDVDYKYSSASYYETGIPNWDFLYTGER